MFMTITEFKAKKTVALSLAVALLGTLVLSPLTAHSKANTNEKKAVGKSVGKSAGKSVGKTGRKPNQANGVDIVPVDPDIDPSAYEEDGFNVRLPGEPRSQREIPHPELRDQIFKAAGLTGPDFAGWDTMDKDFLFIRARRHSLPELINAYPHIAPKNSIGCESSLSKRHFKSEASESLIETRSSAYDP